MRNVFILSAYRKHKALDYLSEVRREKGHILRDVGLDVLEPIDIETVGGLEPLKSFLNIRKAGWDTWLSSRCVDRPLVNAMYPPPQKVTPPRSV